MVQRSPSLMYRSICRNVMIWLFVVEHMFRLCSFFTSFTHEVGRTLFADSFDCVHVANRKVVVYNTFKDTPVDGHMQYEFSLLLVYSFCISLIFFLCMLLALLSYRIIRQCVSSLKSLLMINLWAITGQGSPKLPQHSV